jgi:hypothetical protein
LRPTQTSALRSSGSWPPAVKAGHPSCLIGDSGTPKSRLLTAFGTLVAGADYRVRCPLAGKMVNALVEAADGKQLTKLINTDVYALGMCQMFRSFLALQRYSVPPGGGGTMILQRDIIQRGVAQAVQLSLEVCCLRWAGGVTSKQTAYQRMEIAGCSLWCAHNSLLELHYGRIWCQPDGARYRSFTSSNTPRWERQNGRRAF